MTIEEIRKYRSLTTCGYAIDGLHEATIEGIKKYREQHKPKSWSEVCGDQYQSRIFGSCWSSSSLDMMIHLAQFTAESGSSLKAHSQ
jgi:hypothetical protein